MKKNEEIEGLSYNSKYKQEQQEEKEKNEINKYKYEISSSNNINYYPPLKNSLVSLKEYFNKSENKYKRAYRSKANSFDMSLSSESKILTNFENSFSKKLSFNSPKTIEKKKVNFGMIIGKKVDISLLKQTICEQLKKKNKIYDSLKTNSFCLMKNYIFIPEFGTVGDTILSDGDDVYIILKESMDKCQEEEKSKGKKK